MLVTWHPIRLTKVIRYKIYIKLYKMFGLVMSWPVIVSKLGIKMSNTGIKIVKIRFLYT